MKQIETPYLTDKQARDRLQISRVTLYRLRKEGKIKATMIGGSLRYKLVDIEKMMK